MHNVLYYNEHNEYDICIKRIIMGNSEGEKMWSHIHRINYTILVYQRMERGWNI